MKDALIDQPKSSRSQAPNQAETSKTVSRRKVDRRWIAMVCLLLGVSGAVRYWREVQFLHIENQSKVAPFPLKDIPSVLGTWRALEGAETVLDPDIARIAGSSDHILRTYVDDETGERASVLVLYGLAQLVWGHTPEVCYPASGFRPMIAPRDVPIALDDDQTSVPFREALYGKSRGGSTSFHEVYYSFRNAGEWRTEMGSRWKRFRSNPDMFKIQIERQVKNEQLGDSPCQSLLANLVEEIEKRTENASTSFAVAAAAPIAE